LEYVKDNSPIYSDTSCFVCYVNRHYKISHLVLENWHDNKNFYYMGVFMWRIYIFVCVGNENSFTLSSKILKKNA